MSDLGYKEIGEGCNGNINSDGKGTTGVGKELEYLAPKPNFKTSNSKP